MSESNHSNVHVLDQIEAYLSNGLTPEESAAFEAHAAACPSCSAALAEARKDDATLHAMFSDAQPPTGLEDRIIRGLRLAGAPRRRLIHPIVLRTAAAMAAAVLVTSAGVVVSNVAERGRTGIAWIDGRVPAIQHRANTAVDLESDGVSDLSGIRRLMTTQDLRPTASADQAIRGKPAVQPMGQSLSDDSKAKADFYGYYRQLGEQKDLGLSYGGRAEHAPSPTKDGDNSHFGEATVANNPTSDTAPVTGTPTGTLADHGAPQTWAFRPADQFGRVYKSGGAADRSGMYLTLGTVEDKSAPIEYGIALTKKPDERGTAVEAPSAAVDAPAPRQPAPASPTVNDAAASTRKVIRNGTMEFEVASFDDALLRVTKLAIDQGGFVATTDSEKLPNGKVKGTITLRVPPEHLDTLVLTLRGIGDLKSQKIAAEDVTRHYTDLESELRAARAMQDRLLEIIKSGKGQIKDLLEAEKQLGVWREKIEQIEGEKRYLDNQIALSTLALTLYERDIKTPASLQETEQVAMSLETDKVDDAYEKARAAISAAKGRIIQSELKQFDAGQFGATIQAALPPDSAEQAIARLRQLSGRIAHFSRDHRQTTPNGAASAAPISEVHREDVVVTMQIYNLANVAPRRMTSEQLAAANVEKAYHDLIEQVQTAGGRIVTSSLTRPDATQQTADLDVQVPTEKADAIEQAIRAAGTLMRQDSTENPDTGNVTESKRGFHVKIVALAAVPARESQKLDLAAANVPEAFNAISDAVRAAQGRILQSDVNEQDRNNVTGTISFEVSRPNSIAVLGAIGKNTQVLTRAVTRSSDVENTVDSKLHLVLSLRSADALPARQTTVARYEVSDVERAVDDLVNAATSAGGRRVGNGQINTDGAGHVTGQVVVDVPLSKAQPILDQLERGGSRRGKQVSFDNTVPDGPLARARIDATFSNSAASLGGQESAWDSLRHGLATSTLGLRWSLRMLVIGLCFVAPWVVVLWLAWRLFRWTQRRPPASA